MQDYGDATSESMLAGIDFQAIAFDRRFEPMRRVLCCGLPNVIAFDSPSLPLSLAIKNIYFLREAKFFSNFARQCATGF